LSEDDLLNLLDEDFLTQALARFDEMAKSLSLAVARHE